MALIAITGVPAIASGSGYGYSPIGLKNIGNTCFMNSILQCIFATAPLTQYFMSKNGFVKESSIRTCRLSTSYCELLYKARKNKSDVITPSDLKQQVSRVARQFSGYGQQDSQEFLRFMLDGMHNELNRVKKKPKYKQIDCDKLPMDQQSEVWHQYFQERDNSIITDLFEGQLCSKIECMKCGYQSLTFDNFSDLSLSIPNKMSMGSLGVADCLKNFVASERMEKCGYKCSKCKAVDKMEKDITVYRFPKILVIHLKRFSRREKLTTTVTVPKKLDMSVYGPYSSKLVSFFHFSFRTNVSI